MNSCNTDIFFSNYYHLLSVRFELCIALCVRVSPKSLMLSFSRKALSVMFLMYIWMRVQSDMELGQWKERWSRFSLLLQR